MTKPIKFKQVKKHEEFIFDRTVFLKTTDTLGVSQAKTVKHRNYLIFSPDCIVQTRTTNE